MVPLYATFVYVWAGEAAGHAAKFFSPCFFVSLAAGFHYFVRRFGSRTVALTFTGMLMGIHMADLAAFHYAGYADTAVAASLLLGAGFLYAWLREGAWLVVRHLYGPACWAPIWPAVMISSGGSEPRSTVCCHKWRRWRCWRRLWSSPPTTTPPKRVWPLPHRLRPRSAGTADDLRETQLTRRRTCRNL
ncbi:MAG: hypothetical protein HY236_01930 [Acidobacteria bacterium]|nr:hypothetical protein [Acidobacteriota bacterium]